MIGSLVQVSVDGEWDIFLEIETDRWHLGILSRKDNQQIGCSGNGMPEWRQDILIGNHPIGMFFVERYAFFKQLLCYIVHLLSDDLFGKKRAISPIGDHPLCPIRDRSDLDWIAVPIKQLRRGIGIAWLNRSESHPLLNDWSPTRARIHLLDQILASNASGGNLNSSAVNDRHEYILLLAN